MTAWKADLFSPPEKFIVFFACFGRIRSRKLTYLEEC